MAGISSSTLISNYLDQINPSHPKHRSMEFRHFDFGCAVKNVNLDDAQLNRHPDDNDDEEIEINPIVENQDGNTTGDAEVVPAIAEW